MLPLAKLPASKGRMLAKAQRCCCRHRQPYTAGTLFGSPAAGGCPDCPGIHGPQAAGPILSASAGLVDRSEGRLHHGGGRYQRLGPSCSAGQEQEWAQQLAGELSCWWFLQSFSHLGLSGALPLCLPSSGYSNST